MQFKMGSMTLELQLPDAHRDNLLRILCVYHLARGAGMGERAAQELFALSLAESNCSDLMVRRLREQAPEVCRLIAGRMEAAGLSAQTPADAKEV